MPVPGIWDLMEASWIEQNCCNSYLSIDLRIEGEISVNHWYQTISWSHETLPTLRKGILVLCSTHLLFTPPMMTLEMVMMMILMSSLKSLPHLRHGAGCKQSIPAPCPRYPCTDTREPWISDERVSCFYSDEVKLKGIGSQHNFAPDKENMELWREEGVWMLASMSVSGDHRWHGHTGHTTRLHSPCLVIIKTGGNKAWHQMMTLYMRRVTTIHHRQSQGSPPSLPVGASAAQPGPRVIMLSALCSPARAQSFNPGQTWHPSRITSPGVRLEFPEWEYIVTSHRHGRLCCDPVITNIPCYSVLSGTSSPGHRTAAGWLGRTLVSGFTPL